MSSLVVAIDGPSGSGKSTISKTLAGEFSLAYLDTGAMYRAATWWCVHEGIDLDDKDAVAEAVASLPLEIAMDPANVRFMVAGVDVSQEIRMTAISTVVSKVATNLQARPILQDLQRAFIKAEQTGGFSGGRGIIAEGRDITTVIAPGADVRILLKASEEARLARRAREVHGAADAAAIAATRDQVVRRDSEDSTVSNFTTAADGVVTIDTSDLTLNESIAAVRSVISAHLDQSSVEKQ